jgi:hypothetical protein
MNHYKSAARDVTNKTPAAPTLEPLRKQQREDQTRSVAQRPLGHSILSTHGHHPARPACVKITNASMSSGRDSQHRGLRWKFALRHPTAQVATNQVIFTRPLRGAEEFSRHFYGWAASGGGLAVGAGVLHSLTTG